MPSPRPSIRNPFAAALSFHSRRDSNDHEAHYPNHVRRSVLQVPTKRELFDVLDSMNDPFHVVWAASTNPDEADGDAPCRVTISEAGHRRAVSSVANAVGHPPHPIDVYPVLVLVMLFLPCDWKTLMSVGNVCRAWRLASSLLPQWALLPPLCRMFDAQYSRNLLVLRDYVSDDLHDRCLLAATRDDVLQSMALVRATEIELRDDKHAPCSQRASYIMAVHALRALASGAVIALCMGMCAVVAATAVGGSSALNSDALIALVTLPLGLLGCAAYAGILRGVDARRSPPFNRRGAIIAASGTFPYLAVIGVVLVTLATPFALTCARYATATTLRDGPWLDYATCEASAPSSPPTYVAVGNILSWTVSPTLSSDPSWHADCQVPASSSWLEYYLTYTGNWEDFTCYDNPVDDVEVVYLLPPSRGTCNNTTPIALAFQPTSSTFRSFMSAFNQSGPSSSSAAMTTTWLRAESTGSWLQTDASAWCDSWYGANWSWPDTVPLAAADFAPSPTDLVNKWLAHVVFFVALVCLLYVGANAAVVTSVVRVSTRPSDVFGLLVMALGLNPLLCIVFGAKCALAPDDDVCMMDEEYAWILFGVGTLMTAAAVAFCVASSAKPWAVVRAALNKHVGAPASFVSEGAVLPSPTSV